jgi:AraC-like DNA-binding protein
VELLKQAIRAYAGRHADSYGLALTPVRGLMMKCVESPTGDLHAVCRPLVILVLQGAKRMTVGREEQVFSSGQSVIISADMPIATRIIQASPSDPYLAIAVELETALLCDVAAQLDEAPVKRRSVARTLFTVDTDAAALDCMLRLMRLLDRPESIPLLRPGIMRELHYWLLSGRHGGAIRALCDPASHASRLAAAIAILRAEYRSRVPVERLAETAAMSLTAFHKHFKHMTSLTPGQYQKRLRLMEARRLMLEMDASASSAAFQVGYESVSQFTRDYSRLFQASPKRDARSARSGPRNGRKNKGDPVELT